MSDSVVKMVDTSSLSIPLEHKGQRVGEKLISLQLITADQLRIALHEQRHSGKMIGTILVKLGFLQEETLAAVLAERTGLQRVDLKSTVIDPALVRQLPKDVASRCRALPIASSGGDIEIAMADPYDIVALDHVRRFFPRHMELVPVVVSESDIRDAIDQYYGYETSIEGILQELEAGSIDLSLGALDAERYVHPIVRLVNAILLDAVKLGASDIHFEPESNFIRLRYRLDGVLTQMRALHKAHWPAISHRLKIIASMNIADTRHIQDGRFSMHLAGTDIDFRAALLPTIYGENIVFRILDHRRALLPLEALGFEDHHVTMMRRLLRRPEGIILVTGPTGSGKTTTLYSLLREISSVEVNIMTLEEPVEYQLGLIRQTAIQEDHGLGFVDGVRAILRQDPDVIFIGEIRDGGTAEMALRSAMTGHQVFSTLHTNDAFGAVPRLLDFGLNPKVLAGNISGVLAQRLVRKLCPHCKEMRPATKEECAILGVEDHEPPMIGHAKGCDLCRGTGYKGRLVIAEILPFIPPLDDAYAEGVTRRDLLKVAKTGGYIPMRQDGIQKVLKGIISLESLAAAISLDHPPQG
jgi:type II secretory ATPase GspE/PulE/Tfp pilus assembly ATPase PilB-like protein